MKTNMRFSDDQDDQQVINNKGWSTPKLVGFWFLVILLAWILGGMLTSCKKKETKPQEEPIITQSAPKGNMEGEYIWFAGDTAVSNLIVTVQCLSCNDPAIPYSIDYYWTNHYITPYDQSNHYKVKAGYKSDTIVFAYKGHIYNFYRKP